MNAFIVSARNLLIMTLLLGGLYPLLVTLLGQTLFPIKSQGSLLKNGDRYVGSELIAQKFSRPEYFWPRPSSIDYKSESSGATNKSATSEELKQNYLKRKKELGEKAPNDLLYTSGSGLDPHISIDAAHFQQARVMRARNMGEDELNLLIARASEERFLGFMGRPRVNVIRLNQLLDMKQEGK